MIRLGTATRSAAALLLVLGTGLLAVGPIGSARADAPTREDLPSLHEIYEQAKRQGHVASLLTQERANIFSQSVANIEPGKNIDINIKDKF